MHQPFKVPTLNVADIELPREFERLYDLAYNLWWTWTPAARDLFASIDPSKWGLYRNPVQMLIDVDPKQWHPLLESEAFRRHYDEVIGELSDYLGRTDTWYEQQDWQFDGPIGYFSMEYGLHQCLAIYSGGLGVLSGDHTKAASNLGLPFVGLGLLYRHGYFQQSLDAEGQQQHAYPEYDFSRLPLRPVASRTGGELIVHVPMPGRQVAAKVWLAQVGRVPLLLLDTDIPENDPSDRPITNQLYVSGREMRLVQEIVLGMGGARVLEELGIEPHVWHLNEGHSVFLQMERWRRAAAYGESSGSDILALLRRTSVFTTHTPVPAGNEQFDPSLVVKYFSDWCEEVGLSVDEFLAMGKAHDHEDSFNLTALAIRSSRWVNGVSKLNAEVSSRMWQHLFPADTEQPVQAITNGVHARTFIGPELQVLLRRRFDARWEDRLLEADSWPAVSDIPDEELWKALRAQRERLGRFTRSRLREQYALDGASPDELRAVEGILDPKALTIGFARRFATYKRANLVFSDLHRLQRILCDPQRPVQMLFAGKAHPADRPGQHLIQHIFELSRSQTFAGKVIFLENYDLRMGRMLVQGVDVWLNTPRRPMEASGTSGQKVAMNGGLNFSIADGWWPEGWNGDNGWVIGEEKEYGDERAQDNEDAESLYQLLETAIVPTFYDRDSRGLPRRWIRKMKNAMSTLTPQFSAARMVRDYAVRAYRSPETS